MKRREFLSTSSALTGVLGFKALQTSDLQSNPSESFENSEENSDHDDIFSYITLQGTSAVPAERGFLRVDSDATRILGIGSIIAPEEGHHPVVHDISKKKTTATIVIDTEKIEDYESKYNFRRENRQLNFRLTAGVPYNTDLRSVEIQVNGDDPQDASLGVGPTRL